MRILCLALFLCLTVASLPLAAHAAESSEKALPTPGPDKLGGADRSIAVLSTDKPVYKPGDTVYARAVFLDARTFFPLRGNQAAGLDVTGPRKEKVFSRFEQTSDSTAGFSWTIPAGTPGGRYEARASLRGGPVAVREFEVRAYAPPRLKTQIEFLREGYGPGDTVTASVSVARAEGGVPRNARVTAVARVDGNEAARVENLTVNADGLCSVSFPLPRTIDRGEGSLVFAIEDGGIVETASKTIPILLRTMDIAFYPEGGDLVAGLAGRVYVQANRPDGKPADIAGEIVRVDSAGKALSGKPQATLTTVHEGRGVFTFTPAKGERYALRLLSPSGIDRLFSLPEAKPSGVALRALKNSFAFGEPIRLEAAATQTSGIAAITVFQREEMLARATVKPGKHTVTLDPGDREGVFMVTAWNAAGTPLAERLVFREPRFALQIGVTLKPEPANGSFTPGSTVRLTVETRDHKGNPVEAVVGLTVTDDAVLEMVETRDKAPSLPVMAYLENEVRDLADARVYLDPNNPEAGRDVDLLLGTQGWRRFVLTRLDEALEKNPDGVRRILAMREALPPPQIPRLAARMQAQQAPAIPQGEAVAEKAAMPDNAAAAPMNLEERPEPGPAEQPAPPAPPAQPPAHIDQEMAEVEGVLGREAAAPIAWDAKARISIREYAHTASPDRKPNQRTDFTETVYWNAGLRTNPRDGSASVTFALSDSVTAFTVLADGFGNNGALGAATAELSSLEPFRLEAKLPVAVVAGDSVTLPLTFVNATAESLNRTGLTLKADGLESAAPAAPASLAPEARTRVLSALDAKAAGTYSIAMNGVAGPYTDSVTRSLTVLPRGFGMDVTGSGLVGPEKPHHMTIALPPEIEAGSMRATAKVYPSPLANMEEALNALLKKPHGCFEQTSSTSYPLVMAQQYFLSHAGVSPDKIKKATGLLDESYRKLVGFESPQKGYEWFGADPGHEALTAYGLMQFSEMSKVMPVDAAMLERTRAWLLSRRDGKGGFKRNAKALDSFGSAPVPLTNLYILWTLLETGDKPTSLRQEIEAAKKQVGGSKDTYILAIGANVLFLAGETEAAATAATRLQGQVKADGSLPEAETSITRSRGDALGIETASFAVLAWLRLGDSYAGTVEKTMGWLFERCKAGRFGSTQSTILALKAINAYDAARAKPKAPGTIRLVVDDEAFGKPVAFDEKTQDALELPDFSTLLTPGEHTLELVMEGGNDMPFAVEITYATPQPANSDKCPLRLATALSAREITEGEPVDLAVSVTAKDADVPMPLAIIGMPAGLEPRHERLKELAAQGSIAAYEIRGRELVLYWRALQANRTIEVTIPMTAEIPGTYTAPASRVYAFYQDEDMHWAAGTAITVRPR